MKLGVRDRILLVNLLPQRGSFLELSVAEEIRKLLEFSDTERETLQLKQDESGRISWNDKAEEPRSFELGQGHMAMIAKELTALEAKRELHADYLDLYRQFASKPAA